VVRVRMIKSLQVTFYISTNVQFTCSKMTRYIQFIILYVNHINIVSFDFFCSIVCIKREVVLEADQQIVSQIQLVDFNEGYPYENLHSFVSGAMATYFKSYIK
jgi:dynein heavy chain 1